MIGRRLGALVVSATLHAMLALMLIVLTRTAGSSSAEKPARDSSDPNRIAVFVVPPEPPSLPGLRPADAADSPASVTGPTLLSVPGLTLDFRKVAARVSLLFPPIAPGLALEQFLPVGLRVRPNSFSNPLIPEREPDREAPPLLLNQSTAQAIVDKSWSRHERWRAFQNLAPMLAAYNPNDGDLPQLLQMYFEQNGLQPFIEEGAADPKLWAQLAVAADHVDFIGIISRYASARPASKSTTSLLLVLDTLVQSNLEVLLTLLSIDPAADLQLTRHANEAAYAFVADTQRHYRLELAKRHLNSIDDVKTYYDAIRLAILDTVVRTTPGGYRAGDARYLMGAVYWRQGNAAAAIEQWRGIHQEDSDSYAFAYSAILRALEHPAESVDLNTGIERALVAERGHWRSLSYDRLKRFGYRFDTF